MGLRSIEIRKATNCDLEAMQEIARRTIDKCYRPFLGDEGVDWFIDSGESDREVERQLDNCDLVLHKGMILGFVVFFDDLIHLMMVDERLQRQGIGTVLLQHAEQQLRIACRSALRLETFEGNDQAIRFYRKHGWSITGKQEDKQYGFVRVFFEKKQ